MSRLDKHQQTVLSRRLRALATRISVVITVCALSACGSDAPASAATTSGPPSQGSTPSPAPTATPDVPAIYIVKAGDTGLEIAASFGIALGDLARANDTTEEALDVLHIGQQLRIPR